MTTESEKSGARNVFSVGSALGCYVQGCVTFSLFASLTYTKCYKNFTKLGDSNEIKGVSVSVNVLVGLCKLML